MPQGPCPLGSTGCRRCGAADCGGRRGCPPPVLAESSSTEAERPFKWSRVYNSGGLDSLADDFASSVLASPDGSRVFVIGSSELDRYDYRTVAYDPATGALLWTRRYNGPGNGNDVPYGFGVSPDGSALFVTGGSTDANGLPDFLTVAYRSTTGDQLWAKRDGAVSTYDVANALTVTPNGAVVVVTGGSGGDQLTSAYNASTGARLWSKRVAGAFGVAIDVSPDGSKVFVTASQGGDYFTSAYRTSTGVRLWSTRYSAGRTDHPSGVVASPDGARLFVTGRSEGATSDYDYTTVAYSAATGSRLWVRRYNGPGGGADAAADVALKSSRIDGLCDRNRLRTAQLRGRDDRLQRHRRCTAVGQALRGRHPFRRRGCDRGQHRSSGDLRHGILRLRGPIRPDSASELQHRGLQQLHWRRALECQLRRYERGPGRRHGTRREPGRLSAVRHRQRLPPWPRRPAQ